MFYCALQIVHGTGVSPDLPFICGSTRWATQCYGIALEASKGPGSRTWKYKEKRSSQVTKTNSFCSFRACGSQGTPWVSYFVNVDLDGKTNSASYC